MTWIYCRRCKKWHYTRICTVNRCPYCGQDCFATDEDIDDMPTVCDIEQIRAEIEEYKDDKVIHAERNEMIDIVLEIISKHTKGDKE